MTPKQMAGLRALAETASGVVLVCNRHDVLALLDEVERLREALEFVQRGIQSRAIKSQPVLDMATGAVVPLAAKIAAALEPRA